MGMFLVGKANFKIYIHSDYNHKSELCVGPKASFWEHKASFCLLRSHSSQIKQDTHNYNNVRILDKSGHHESPEENLPDLEATQTHLRTLK